MNFLIKAVGTTAITVALATLSIPAFASTGPAFSAAKPGSGESIDSFKPDVRIFNRAEIGELLGAKTVSVVRIDNGWKDGDDASSAFEAVTNSDQAIHELRQALKNNPAAEALLARHHVNVNTVVDIVGTGNGAVQLYVS